MNLALFRALPRLSILTFIAAAVSLGLAFGSGTFDPGSASAEATLELEGSCEPESIRPNEPAVISCTVSISNTGDEAATNLSGSVFLADDCAIPGNFYFIDRVLDGVLMPPLGLSFDVPDIAPGQTAVQTSRLVTQSSNTGPTGGSVTISSGDTPGLSATIDLCHEVSADAAAPGDELEVTKTNLSADIDEPPPVPVAGDPDGDVEPLPTDPDLPTGPEEASFEIVITNVSDGTVSNISLLDVPTGDAVFVGAEPPVTSLDALGRPTWDVGDLAPGDDFRVIATFGAPDDGNCAYADDIAIATGTPDGGASQDYVAYSDFGVQVGPCSFFPLDYCSHYPPGDGEPVQAPCDESICWAETPDGDRDEVIYGCDESVDYCFFVPPAEAEESYTPLRPCDESVCWFNYGFIEEGFEFYSDVPCDLEFCEYTGPDGTTVRSECEFPVCWAQDPATGLWQQAYGCGQFDENPCWFTAPDGSRSSWGDCNFETCWLTFQPGDYLGEVPCELQYCNYSAPDGSSTWTGECEFPTCWSQAPDGTWQNVYDCGEFNDWCWFAPDGMPELAVLNPCEYPLSFAVNVPDGGIVQGGATLFEPDVEDWCWPVPPGDGEFYTFPVFCDEIEFIYWFEQEDGTWAPSWSPDGCVEILEDVVTRPGRPVPIDIAPPGPCPDADSEGVQGSSVPVEVAEGVSTPAEIVDGDVEAVTPEPSSAVTPIEFATGDVTTLEPVPSADVIPANVVPTDRIEYLETSPDEPPVVLPIDGGPTAPTGPRDDVDEESDRPNDDDGQLTAPIDGDDDNNAPIETTTESDNVTTLPNAGSGVTTGATTVTWLAAALLGAFLVIGFAAMRLRWVWLKR